MPERAQTVPKNLLSVATPSNLPVAASKRAVLAVAQYANALM
jgi:hypothetical protein